MSQIYGDKNDVRPSEASHGRGPQVDAEAKDSRRGGGGDARNPDQREGESKSTGEILARLDRLEAALKAYGITLQDGNGVPPPKPAEESSYDRAQSEAKRITGILAMKRAVPWKRDT